MIRTSPLNTFILWSIFCSFILTFLSCAQAKIVEYTLVIDQKNVNFSGKKVMGLCINGSIPGPTLKATVGDLLRVHVINKLLEETSLHWHGVIVPNRMDGVPGITTPAIQPQTQFTYEFPIKHAGTYWYHAHSGLQEQQGIYGSLVFYDLHAKDTYDEEHVLVLSDWTDEHPRQVLANLKKNPDYYALKKDSVQSFLTILRNGSKAIKLRLKNALHRQSTMDLSDIGYDAFLINGQRASTLTCAKPGTRINLRLINAGASTPFIIEYSGGPMTIIEADGMAIAPLRVKKLKISMAETYNVIVTVPDERTYELRASSEDGTGYAVTHIGQGPQVSANHLSKPNLVLMDMHPKSAMNWDHSHNGMGMTMDSDESKETFLTTYEPLKARTSTAPSKKRPQRTISLRLTGSMERYNWTFNNQPMFAADTITIKKGEVITFILKNETMMHHPIHIHGHFFRVLNGEGNYSPLKHTVNIQPFETVHIEMEANEEKDWIFHCHNLYHMILGMGGTLHYAGTVRDPDLAHHGSNHTADHGNRWFNTTTLEGYSNFTQASTHFMRVDDHLRLEGRSNYKKDHESQVVYQRYVSQFLSLYTGAYFKKETHNIRKRGIVGIEYTLPLFITCTLRLDTHGRVDFIASNTHQLTDRMGLSWTISTEKEYTIGLTYALSPRIAIAGNYDNREHFGIGLKLML